MIRKMSLHAGPKGFGVFAGSELWEANIVKLMDQYLDFLQYQITMNVHEASSERYRSFFESE